MRLHIQLSRNKDIVPFNYQETQVSKLHYWLGKNNVHDSVSLYSFSWLRDGKAIGSKGLEFKNGSKYFISCHDVDLLKQIIKSVQADDSFGYGMAITSLTLEKEPIFETENRFQAASPIFIKRLVEGRAKFYYPSDHEANTLLTETLINKLKKANINHEGINVRFDENYQNFIMKGTTYKGIHNKGTICPIIIQGTTEQLAFAWNVGIGNSTGIGFGSLI
jgi:CRISPR-associated endoribonuclease Cas6